MIIMNLSFSLESGIGNLTQAQTNRQKSKNMLEMLDIDHSLCINLHYCYLMF